MSDSTECSNFLQHLFPPFCKYLSREPPSFGDGMYPEMLSAYTLTNSSLTGPEHKLRNILLEMFNRLPSSDHLATRIPDLLSLALKLLKTESEENAIICLRIIIDLHKNHRPSLDPPVKVKQCLEQSVQPFLDIVLGMYQQLPDTLQQTFTAPPTQKPKPLSASSALGDSMRPSAALPALQSFKVLTECPIIVVLLFQLYPTFLHANIKQFMENIVEALHLTAPEGAYTSHRSAYVDFIAAQVKTLSFLAYLLRGFAEHVRPFQDKITQSAIQLLHSCPNESATIRKELLVATRHILATDFRAGFVSKIDVLLQQRVLIGQGRTAFDTLRPLAYSTLVDLVHHARNELTLKQLSQVSFLYSCNLHDPTLPFGIQAMSAKLLLNLVECIAKKDSAGQGQGRQLLIRILDTFVNKFSSLKQLIDKIVKDTEETGGTLLRKNENLVKDCRGLMKPLVHGLKNIVWGMITSFQYRAAASSAASGTPGTTPVVKSGDNPFSDEDSILFTRLLKNGLKCCSIYAVASISAPADIIRKEEKDVLESFAAVFTMIDIRMFQDIFEAEMPFLFKCILKNQAVLSIPQQFIANPNVSRIMGQILLQYLMSRLNDLAGDDRSVAAVLVRLFKLVFGSVSIFADNEPVLQPHLSEIVNTCVKSASKVQDSTNYFVLLRALFRSIGGGKFDLLYKEFLPLLPMLLDTLNHLRESATTQMMRDLFAELCLTVPVRLSTLLPCLKSLMKPLVSALNSTNQELVSHALRTLELCFDNISPDYLSGILDGVGAELTLSVWKHLRQTSAPHNATAVRILGKLGGRNRLFLQEYIPPSNECDLYRDLLSFRMRFEPDKEISLPLGSVAYMIRSQLLSVVGKEDSKSSDTRRHGFNFVHKCLLSLIPAAPDSLVIPSEPGSTLYLLGSYSSNVFGFSLRSDAARRDRNVVKILLLSMVIAGVDIPEAVTFLEHITDYFVYIFLCSADDQGSKLLEIYSDVLMESLSTDIYVPIIKGLINRLFDALERACGGLIEAKSQPLVSCIVDRVSHMCYENDWKANCGGIYGMEVLLDRVALEWLIAWEPKLAQAILFVLRDLPPELGLSTLHKAGPQLCKLVTRCNTIEPVPTPVAMDTTEGEASAMDVSADSTQQQTQALPQATVAQTMRPDSGITAILVSELASPVSAVRDACKRALEALAVARNVSVTTVLEPSKGIISQQLLSKSLKQFPIKVQTGITDALAYLLQLQPPLLSLRQDLHAMLGQAQDVCSSEEIPPKKQGSQVVVDENCELRTSCLNLLSWALVAPEFKAAENTDFRNMAIGVFFKALTMQSKSVVEAARSGLTRIISNHTISKDLLHPSLRPILLNLGDYRKLNVPLLQGLARLLELLTSFFTETLGDKLLEHLRKFQDLDVTSSPTKAIQPATPTAQQPTTAKVWKGIEETKIPAAIFEIFHLLPSPAVKFLPHLVQICLHMEKIMPRSLSSPFRTPLIKYMNRYPAETLEYFSTKLTVPEERRLFLFVAQSPLAVPFCEKLSENAQRMLHLCMTAGSSMPPEQANTIAGQQTIFEIQLLGINLIHALISKNNRWLVDNNQVVNDLFSLWVAPGRVQRLRCEDMTSSPLYLQETKQLIKCILSYCYHVPMAFEYLFHLASVFAVRTTFDFSFLQNFFNRELVKGYTNPEKKCLLEVFWNKFFDSEMDRNHHSQLFRVLISPLMVEVVNDSNQSAEILDSDLITLMMTKILRSDRASTFSEDLSIELLQLVSMLIQHIPEQLTDFRKDMLQFAWSQSKSEDASKKQWTNVLLSRFIDAYTTPPKQVLQVYATLLRAFQPEARHLVRQALDVLTPALPKRLDAAAEGQTIPSWIKLTRKTVVEEGHSLPQLTHIWGLLVRHRGLFYPCKGQFAHQVVTSLGRIGLLPSAGVENRKLAADLSAVVIGWERTRRERTSPDDTIDDGASAMDTSEDSFQQSLSEKPESTVQPGQEGKNKPEDERESEEAKNKRLQQEEAENALKVMEDDGYTLPPILVESLVNFLVRSACSYADAYRDMMNSDTFRSEDPARSQELLRDALVVWPNVCVKYEYVEKLFRAPVPAAGGDAAHVTMPPAHLVLMGLQILDIVLENHPAAFLEVNMARLQQTILPCLNITNPKISAVLCSVLKRIYACYAPDAMPPSVSGFFGKVKQHIHLGLARSDTPSVLAACNLLKKLFWHDHTSSLLAYVADLNSCISRVAQGMGAGSSTPVSSPKATRTASATAATSSSLAVSQTASSPKKQGQTVNNAGSVVSNPAHQSASDNSAAANALRSLIALLHRLGPELQEQSGLFLRSLEQVIERANDAPLLIDIMDIIEHWVSPKDPLESRLQVSLKEAAHLMLKMMKSDVLATPSLQTAFLNVVYKLHSECTYVSQELQPLEAAFMMGLRSSDSVIRSNFFEVFHRRIVRSITLRLNHIFCVQNWEPLSNSFWIPQALDLVMGVVVPTDAVQPLVGSLRFYWPQVAAPDENNPAGGCATSAAWCEELLAYFRDQHVTNGDIINPVRELMYNDTALSYLLWVTMYPRLWLALTKEEQSQLLKPTVVLLARDYHTNQSAQQPNVVQAILEGIARISITSCTFKIPPALVKYLGRTFNAWHIAIHLLEQQFDVPISNELYDNLAELYQLLGDMDMYFGLAHQMSVLEETRAGLVLEQCGMWQLAQDVFYNAMNNAMNKAKTQTGTACPRVETLVWQEHWIRCAKRLNQWELLADFAKSEQRPDLMLDCSWRVADWSGLKATLARNYFPPDHPLPKICQCYLAIHDTKNHPDIEALYTNSVQTLLQRWNALPSIPSKAHVPVLHDFHRIVSVRESAKIMEDIHGVNRQPHSIQDIKSILHTWRERLPNEWEDIVMWGDILTWRQHVFSIINSIFQPLIKLNSAVAFIGHHETAWSINRFAHIARKHQLVEVCLNALGKIYTLPNIEIQDAFIKLREQVKCYFQLPSHSRAGLDIINTTNLDYFGHQQKAEFFQLKGQFLSRLGYQDDANSAFSTSVMIFDSIPQGWVSWGCFCDRQFTETSKISWAEYAITCFLQAARCRSGKARRKLARVLWLIGFFDEDNKLCQVFEKYADALPPWVWIQWIPQLLVSLSSSEAKQAAAILEKIGSSHPQAIYYILRTFSLEQRDLAQRQATMSMNQSSLHHSHSGYSTTQVSSPSYSYGDSTTTQGQYGTQQSYQSGYMARTGTTSRALASSAPGAVGKLQGYSASQYTDMILNSMKTTHKELIAQLDLIAEEISAQLSSNPPAELLMEFCHAFTGCFTWSDETTHATTMDDQSMSQPMQTDTTMHTSYAATDSTGQTATGQTQFQAQSQSTATQTQSTQGYAMTQTGQQAYSPSPVLNSPAMAPPPVNRDMERVLERVRNIKAVSSFMKLGPARFNTASLATVQETFDLDFITSPPTTRDELVALLNKWVGNMQARIDMQPSELFLENVSRRLVAFYNTTELPVEVPGSYLYEIEPATDRHPQIDRFLQGVNRVRKPGLGTYKISMRSHTGDVHAFFVHSSAKSCEPRAEERLLQLFTVFNEAMAKHKETRGRGIKFTIPHIIPLTPTVRLIEVLDDYTSLQEVWELECSRRDRDLFCACEYHYQSLKGQSPHDANAKINAFLDVQHKLVSPHLLTRFLHESSPSFNHFYDIRNNLISHLALTSFAGYAMCVGRRNPERLYVSKASGGLWHTFFFSDYNSEGLLTYSELVPFRLTPNLNALSNAIGIDGLFNGSMLAAAIALQDRLERLQDSLCLFLRDDLVSWQYGRDNAVKQLRSRDELKERVNANANLVAKNIANMAPPKPMDKVGFVCLSRQSTNVFSFGCFLQNQLSSIPVNKRVSELISIAMSTHCLAQMPPGWQPWL